MKKLVTAITTMLSFFIFSENILGQKVKDISTEKKEGLKLFWSDEFDRAGKPDSSKWGYDIGNGPDGWGNQELEYYTDRINNAFIEDGILKVRAIKENYNGYAYTSARMVSKGKFEFKYGRVEIKAKVPAAIGTWPAVWMMGNDLGKVSWPDCGEMDIMEHRGAEKNKMVAALHYPGHSGGNCVVNSIMVNTATTAFHIYRVDWTSTDIKFYIDDNLFHSAKNSADIPYNKDFFFLVNLAMGGGFGGPVEPGFTSADLEVDYIRVYR